MALHRIAPWRFLMFFAVLLATWVVAPRWFDRESTILVGFDLAALLFLASCIPTLGHEAKEMRALAARTDANRVVLLVLCGVLSAVIFAALVGELSGTGKIGLDRRLLVFGSLALTWIFGHTVCGLHYAHLFYGKDADGNDRAGLEFPGTKEPVMSDFAYFSFTIGVAAQTSDVQVTARHLRSLVTVHAIAGFFFNLGALALAVNILAAG